MRVFIVCPADIATGGTELLHQFSKCLSDHSIENYMFYFDNSGFSCPVPERFMKYGVQYVTTYVDAEDSVLVVSEAYMATMNLCQRGIVVNWWLSVDGYFISNNIERLSDINKFNLLQRTNVIYFAQSHYAYQFLTEKMQAKNVHMLGDYINDEIVEIAQEYRNTYVRENICLYNPAKGYESINPVIDACRDDIVWMPLEGYSPAEMAHLMCRAKVYVDFGGHPGKDRIPREAALCGCCIVTNRKGSAAYSEDVNIPDIYRIQQTDNVPIVLEQIYDLVDNYEQKVKDYEEYRKVILAEKSDFYKDLQKAIMIMIFETASRTKNKEYINPNYNLELFDSFNMVINQLRKLVDSAKSCAEQNQKEGTMTNLLQMDYCMAMLREAVYAELFELNFPKT